MYTATPTTSTLKCQGAPLGLLVAAASTSSPASTSAARPALSLSGPELATCGRLGAPPPWAAPPGALLWTTAALLRTFGAASALAHDGQAPDGVSSGAFQNLLQSSHQGKHVLLRHVAQARPRRGAWPTLVRHRNNL